MFADSRQLSKFRRVDEAKDDSPKFKASVRVGKEEDVRASSHWTTTSRVHRERPLDFLTGRAQSVRIGNSTSARIITSTGTPQGCVLSPILFTHDYVASHKGNNKRFDLRREEKRREPWSGSCVEEIGLLMSGVKGQNGPQKGNSSSDNQWLQP